MGNGLIGKEAGCSILLVEDNPDHAELISISIAQVISDCHFTKAVNGEEALEIMGISPSPVVPGFRPDIVLLDVNLPKMSGADVLQAIRSDSRFNQLPVVVLSTSTRKEEMETMLNLGANAYLFKFDEKAKLGEKISDFVGKRELAVEKGF